MRAIHYDEQMPVSSAAMEQILQRVRALFLARDSELLSFRVNERTVTHRIAVYIEWEIRGWHVDCEYNRHGIAGDPKEDEMKRRRLPDVIVRHRGRDENLLVIEAKPKWASKRAREVERRKLARIAAKYNYKFAYALTYSTGKAPDLWFEAINW